MLELVRLGEILVAIENADERAWLYLPRDTEWSSDTGGALLQSEEVAAEEEDLPDAGVPKVALDAGLVQVLPLTTVQDVVANARAARPSVEVTELIAALKFYYERDAFIDFGPT
jgi:hypothetical protein